MKPRISAKKRRRLAAERIATRLFTGSTIYYATRLVMVVKRAGGGPDIEVGGWSEASVIDLLEAELRPGRRRMRAR